MTVLELIEALKDCNPEAKVMLCTNVSTPSGVSDLVDIVIEEETVYLDHTEYYY